MATMTPPPREQSEQGARLSIGALSRATGIPVETLRTWESRYGFPVPERKPSGHRVYPVSSVERLRRIGHALSRGHRAGDVLTASERDLNLLLDSTDAVASPTSPVARASGTDLPELLRLVETFEAERLIHVLLTEWARVGPLDFVEAIIAPLVHAVGEGWKEARFDIYHEHFISERVGDLLRSLRLPFEERASGPLVVFGSLPKEQHALGLQMATLVTAAAGCRVLNLGTEVPVPQLASLPRDLNARALAVSVSVATRGSSTNAGIRRLREQLPRRVSLLVGGAGAPKKAPAGVDVFADLRALDAWARRAAG
jgi:methanogenic corrinoid protein MtbC1